MPTPSVCERAAADFSAGRHREGRRRLRDLLDFQPQNLPARELLIASYRETGHPDQAGRWAFVSDDVSEDEIRAFARTFQNDPVQMMRAVHWAGETDDAPTEAGRKRMHALRADVAAVTGRTESWELWRSPGVPSSRFDRVLGVLLGGILIFLVLCMVVGLVTVVRAVIGRF